jgi:hypothetical protein
VYFAALQSIRPCGIEPHRARVTSRDLPPLSEFAMVAWKIRLHLSFIGSLENLLELTPSQGTSATGDCCSKCFNDMQKKQGNASAPVQVQVAKAELKQEAEPAPMEVDETVMAQAAPEAEEEEAKPVAEEQKKKKKKPSYKNMLRDMMASSPDRNIEQEKEKLRQVTGGGQFQKIEKI